MVKAYNYQKSSILADHFVEGEDYFTNRSEGLEDALLTYTLEGEGYFVTPQNELRSKPGDVVLLSPRTPHHYGTSRGHTWNFVWMHFPYEQLDMSLLPAESLWIQPIGNPRARKHIYAAFKRILYESRQRALYWQELCLTAVREILMLSLRNKDDHRLDARVAEVMTLLSERMQEPIRIDELAAAVHLSPSRLAHLFKDETGQSIVQALNRMRVRQAAMLLRHTDRPAAEVASLTGFTDYNHFARQFHKIYGMPPRHFKNSQPRKE